MRHAWFHYRCAMSRLLGVLVLFPIGLIAMPFLILKGRASFRELLDIFDPREWNEMIGDGPEMVFAPYTVTESKYTEGELPPNCWFSANAGKVFCLDYEDAVWVRLKYNGNITKRPLR